MPDRPRAIVTIDLQGPDGARTVTITVPALVEHFRPGERLSPGLEDRILVDLRGTLARLGVALDDAAIVIVERVDGPLAWCRVSVN